MQEDYSLFYRILEGDLSPFLRENTREENFSKYFKDDSVCELNEFLIDNTIHVTFITQSYRISKYYYSVIHKECNRLVSVFDQEHASSEDKTAFSSHITKQYERLLLLMKKVHTKQHAFGQEFTARYENMVNLDNKYKKQSTIRDIFYYFNEYLIEFSIHIASHYDSHITVEKYKNRHELYPKLFHEPSPLSFTKNDSIRTYLADTRRFVEKNNFDLKESKLLLTNVIKVFNNFSNLKSSVSRDEEFNQTFINNIKALENLIFINTHKIGIDLKSYTVLTSEYYNSSTLESFKKLFKEKLVSYNNSVDSLDFINTLLRTNDSYKVNNKVPEDVRVNSLPRLAEEWLNLQKDFFVKFLSDSTSDNSNKNSNDINTNSSNMKNLFLPCVVSFLVKADPYDKYRSKWSCSGYYFNLQRRFLELKPQFTLYITSIPQSDRQNVINAYISHVNNVTSQYVAGTGSNAAYFLKTLSISLTDFFEKPANEIPPNDFYKYIRDTYEAIDRKDGDYKILDLISAFIFHISDYFIDELMSFFKSLLVQENNYQTTVSHENVSAPQSVSVKNFPDSLDNFFESADITSKYKSDCSCSSYYAVLRDKCKSVQADILNLYSSVLPENKQSFIKSYLMKIEGAVKNYIGGTTGHAIKYLKDNDFNFEDFFETEIFKNNAPTGTLPGCLRLSYNDFYDKVFDPSIHDLRTSFFHLISDNFIEKLNKFITELPDDNTTPIHTKAEPSVKKNAKVIPVSFEYINHTTQPDAIDDLYDNLKKNRFIYAKTDKRIFRKVFTARTPEKKIKWTGNISELHYFIKFIHLRNKSIQYLGNNIWKVTAKCFCDSKGKDYDFKSFRNLHKPSSAKLLESAASQLN